MSRRAEVWPIRRRCRSLIPRREGCSVFDDQHEIAWRERVTVWKNETDGVAQRDAGEIEQIGRSIPKFDEFIFVAANGVVVDFGDKQILRRRRLTRGDQETRLRQRRPLATRSAHSRIQREVLRDRDRAGRPHQRLGRNPSASETRITAVERVVNRAARGRKRGLKSIGHEAAIEIESRRIEPGIQSARAQHSEQFCGPRRKKIRANVGRGRFPIGRRAVTPARALGEQAVVDLLHPHRQTRVVARRCQRAAIEEVSIDAIGHQRFEIAVRFRHQSAEQTAGADVGGPIQSKRAGAQKSICVGHPELESGSGLQRAARAIF